TVKDLELGTVEKFKIVGSQEANPLTGRISDDSPFGRGLFGHEAGEIVEVEAPMGVLKFEIISIEK
ncbi:MAG: GreA/GreB family elongation factor, partial [Oscillospiraceae bacterium]|nr:GreA/GreB family elongation factor [Oscillospiraceae bacterium]